MPRRLASWREMPLSVAIDHCISDILSSTCGKVA